METLTAHQKLTNTILYLKDLMLEEAALFISNHHDKAKVITIEKEEVLQYLEQNHALIASVAGAKKGQEIGLPEEDFVEIKQTMADFIEVMEENGRIIAQRLYISGIIISSFRKVAISAEKKVHVYGANGGSIAYSRRTEHNAFEFNTTV